MIKVLNARKMITTMGAAALLLTIGGSYHDVYAAETKHVQTSTSVDSRVQDLTFSYKDPVTNKFKTHSLSVNGGVDSLDFDKVLRIVSMYVSLDNNISREKANTLTANNVNSLNVTYLDNGRTINQTLSKDQPELDKKYDTKKAVSTIQVTYKNPKTKRMETTEFVPDKTNWTKYDVTQYLFNTSYKKYPTMTRSEIRSIISSSPITVKEQTSITDKVDVTKIENNDIVKKSTTTITPKPVESRVDNVETKMIKRYTQPMRYNLNGGATYDFGAGDSLSGINNAANIAKSISNKNISIRQIQKNEKSNVVVIGNYNNNSHTGNYTYGSGVAIGKHTIVTAAHVVDDSGASKKAFTSKPVSQLEVQPNRNGRSIPTRLTVDNVRMIKQGDVAIVHTKEDLSKYVPIRSLASESSIKNLKPKDTIYDVHYGEMKSDKYKDENIYSQESIVPYRSQIKFLGHATNIHPVGYVKGYLTGGSSGSGYMNSKNQVIGVHSFVFTSDENLRNHVGGGYMFINDLYKNVKKEQY